MKFMCLHSTDPNEHSRVESLATLESMESFLAGWGRIVGTGPVGNGLRFEHEVRCGDETFLYETTLHEDGRILNFEAVPSRPFMMALLLWFRYQVSSEFSLQVIVESGAELFEVDAKSLFVDVDQIALFIS